MKCQQTLLSMNILISVDQFPAYDSQNPIAIDEWNERTKFTSIIIDRCRYGLTQKVYFVEVNLFLCSQDPIATDQLQFVDGQNSDMARQALFLQMNIQDKGTSIIHC